MFSKDSKASITPTTPATPTGANGDSAKITGVPSIISPDLKIIGDLKSSGDIQIDGTIEGDINSRLLTVGEQATVEGCIVPTRCAFPAPSGARCGPRRFTWTRRPG